MNKKNKFNVGDIVRVIDYDGRNTWMERMLRKEAVIENFRTDDRGDWWYMIADNGWFWREKWLVLVQRRDGMESML